MFRPKIDKEELAQLQAAHYEGTIRVVQSDAEALKAVTFLSKQKILGFDTETKPSFAKGKSNAVCLVQLSTNDTCFLFRLRENNCLEILRPLFENENILKIGLSLKDDFRAIRKQVEFNPAGFVELQTYVKPFGIEDNSLSKIFAIIFNKRISKSQRLTNWEADFLTEKQKSYAALDAWATLRIYEELERQKDNIIIKQ
ncbi:MAG: 3'-5' exonuclease domain-containing protein 2 [Paludibacteraceae bacterium]|nr:3'-5' exonuclease domain-containing protein 2 [Paludibacteraceae bacterium]